MDLYRTTKLNKQHRELITWFSDQRLYMWGMFIGISPQVLINIVQSMTGSSRPTTHQTTTTGAVPSYHDLVSSLQFFVVFF
jgi:hypothetical protein